MCVPILKGDDIRYNFALGGGGTMDTGCYTINCIRFLLGDYLSSDAEGWEEGQEDLTIEVTAAEAVTCYPEVDKHMKAKFKCTMAKNVEGKAKESEDGQQEEEKE